MVRVDLRTVTLNVPPQEVITKDNVTVRVNAVAYFRVIDPNKAITEVENFLLATSQIAQTTLRSVLGKAELDALLVRARAPQRRAAADHRRADRALGRQGHARSRSRTSSCRPTCSGRSPRQAEAERERRAKIIAADGEFQAAEKLAQAAEHHQPATRRRSSSATCRRCSRSASTRTRRSSSRCRST